MIRPSPTSISLSASDISAHLKHIEINQGLLKQGFKGSEIRKFFREQNVRTLEEAGISEADLGMTPTWIDLVAHRRESTQSTRDRTGKSISNRSSMLAEVSTSQNQPRSAEQFISIDSTDHHSRISDLPREEQDLSLCDRRASSPASYSAALSPVATCFSPRQICMESGHRPHVPRQSSLLRFSSNASPKYNEAEEEEEQLTPFVSCSPQSAIRNRPRTETHSYEHSESDEIAYSPSLISVFETLALNESLVPNKTPAANQSRLRGDARNFTPLTLPPPFDFVGQADYSATQSFETVLDEQTPCTSKIVPTLRSTVDSHAYTPNNLRRSSSLELGPSNPGDGGVRLSPELPVMPSTPFVRRAKVSRTEPRARGNQYLDGPSFIPYNDSLPASGQPQTPADVSRQPFINEFSAAYTEPPGRLHGHDQTLLAASDRRTEAGEQSPTTQAISMRQRRNREFARGARVEGLRISRLRRRLRAGRAPELNNTQHDLEEFWADGGPHDLWRDDLDADRVGEENFEDVGRLTDTTGAGVRVISGNRRARGI